jgi:hypothetical protein
MSCSIKDKIVELTGQNPGQNVYVIETKHQNDIVNIVQTELDRLKDTDFTLIPFELVFDKTSTGNTTLRVNFDPKVEPNYLTFLDYEQSQRELEILKEWQNRNGEQLTIPFPSAINNIDLSEAADNFLPTPIVSKPVNFKEWRNNREEMIKKLEGLANRYRKLGEKVKLGQVNKAIKELKDQLKKVNSNDATVLHESLIKEINILDDLLTLVNEDAITGLDLLEANDIRQRIDDLSMYFVGKDIEGKFFSKTMKDLLEQTFPDDIKNIRDRINNLTDKYLASTTKIIIAIYEDDTVVKEHKRIMSKDDWDNFHGKITEIINENKQSDRIGEERRFLSAKQVNSVLADLLISLRDANYQKEAGITKQLLIDLKNSWLKIMTLTNMQGEKLTDKLYKKNVFGGKTPIIISMYNDKFGKILSSIANYRTLFYQKQNSTSYKNWMQEFKAGIDIIEPYKLKVFYDLYKNNPAYKEFFNYSEAEMQQYEKELRDKLGNTIYETELKKQLESIKNYLFELDNNLLGSVMDRYSKNPMKFTQNFYSDNFDKPDIESALYLEPTYVSYFPKNEINQEFKKIESEEHGKELMDFWKIAHELERYANPIFQSENISMKNGELINVRNAFAEINNSEATKQIKLFKKIPVSIKAGIHNFLAGFTANQDNRIKKEEGKRVKDINTSNSSYGKDVKNRWYNYYKSKSINELFDIIKAKGLDITKLQGIPTEDLKEVISEVLAQLEIDKQLNYDMYESITNMVELAKNISTRRNSFNVISLMKDYLKQSKHSKKTHGELNFLTDWSDMNIRGENFGDTLLGGTRNLSLKVNKNQLEKDFENFITKEGKNSIGEYGFTFNDLLYKKVNDKYFEIDGPDMTEITKEKIDEKYNEYTNKFLENLGTPFTAGTVALGLKNNIAKSSMAGAKIAGGVTNRMAGQMQNMNMAITEEAGYNIQQYQWARQFLMFDNINKYILKLGNFSGINKLLGFQGTRKGKKLETLRLFATNLHLLESVIDDLSVEGSDFKTITNDIMNMMFDFSTNNPEWKNQMELLLSIMQTVKIKDKNGNEHPIFNGKTQEFIYIPGTLKLKPEFANVDNKLNYEEFERNTKNEAPQSLLIARYKYAKMGGQGNYAKDDRITFENSVTGRTQTLFVKWLAGNTFRQYGKKDADLSTGKINIEGNKRILFKHAPTAFIYLTLLRPNTNLTFLTGIAGGAAFFYGMGLAAMIGTGIVSIGSIIAIARMLGTFNKNSAFRQDTRNTIKNTLNKFNPYTNDGKQELILALDFAREIAERSINIIPNYLYSTGPIKEENIKTRNFKYMPEGMTEEERNLLSASAMDVAQKAGIYFGSQIAAILFLTVCLLFSGSDDEDEKEKDAKELERLLNQNLNIRNNLMNDIGKYTNPSAYNDAASSFAFMNVLNRVRKNYIYNDKGETAVKNYQDGKITSDQLMSKIAGDVSAFTGLPSQAAKLATDEEYSIIGDKQAYHEKDWLDEILIGKTKNPEDNYKQLIDVIRDEHRNDVKAKIRNYYRDNNQEINEEEISDKVSKFYNELGLIKNKKDTYENTYENIKELDIKQAIEDMDVSSLEKTKKKKRDL